LTSTNRFHWIRGEFLLIMGNRKAVNAQDDSHEAFSRSL
jgi:hypothetical protein